MNKIVLIIITLGLVIVMGIILKGNPKPVADLNEMGLTQNVEIKDGIQYITVKVGGGYSPRVSSAKAGLPTKLIMKTSGVYDCSASLVIQSINFQKILPPTGETEIDLGIPKAGEPLRGICGMGMYNFQINFEI